MMVQSTTNGKILELVDVEHDIAQALTKSPPPRDHRAIGFAPPKVRTPSPPMPPYVEHHADVDQIGKLSAEAVIAQYEGAVKALEAMGTTLIDCVQARGEDGGWMQGCHRLRPGHRTKISRRGEADFRPHRTSIGDDCRSQIGLRRDAKEDRAPRAIGVIYHGGGPLVVSRHDHSGRACCTRETRVRHHSLPLEFPAMSDQQLAVQAISEAQRILEEYLEPIHHDHERLLDRLVEVLERPSVIVAVDRLRRSSAQ